MDWSYYESSSGSEIYEDKQRNQTKRISLQYYDPYRNERLKQNIDHVLFRLKRIFSKEHGAYKDFILFLYNTLFVLNNEGCINKYIIIMMIK